MLTVAVIAGLLALASAHGGNNNWMGSSMNNNQWGSMQGHFGEGTMRKNYDMNGPYVMQTLMSMMNSGYMGGNTGGYMGGNMGGNTGGNMGGGQMGGNMGGGQMGGGQMGGNMGGRQMGGGNMGRQTGAMDGVVLLLLQNVLNSRGAQQQMGGGMNGGMSGGMSMGGDEMAQLEEMMKHKMMVEMAEMIMVYMDFKEKEEKFTEAMEGLCFMVNATYAGYTRRGTTPFSVTTDESVEALGEEFEKMTDMERMESAINILNTNEQQYGEIFLRLATWACMTGDSYLNAAMKMDKMNRQQEDDN